MRVYNLDVTGVNSKYIFARGNVRIKTNADHLQEIIDTAIENVNFYARMHEEISQEGERLTDEVNKKRPYIEITPGMDLLDKISAEVNNEHRQREISAAYGFKHGAIYALTRKEEAHRLYAQAKQAMSELKEGNDGKSGKGD